MDSAVVEQRYQRAPRLSGRGRNVAAVLGVVALTAAVSAVAWPQVNPPITSAVLGYRVVSDTAVEVRFRVDKDPGRAAICTIQARDSAGNVTGSRDVPVPARASGPGGSSTAGGSGGSRSTVLAETVKTTGRSIVGEVLECSLAR